MPPPPDGGGGSGGGAIVDPATGVPPTVTEPGPESPGPTVLASGTSTTSVKAGSETLRPLAGGDDHDEGGGNGTFLFVLGLLAVAVAVGTAAGWFAWRR